jgi:sialic acid synthase SpsE
MSNACEFRIGNKLVGDNHPCFIIAEIGNNHNGDFDMAKELIDVAVKCEVDAVKFQIKNVETAFTKEILDAPYEHINSFGKTYREHKMALEFTHEQYAELQEYSEKKGVIFFATPFDLESLKFMKSINMPVYKISSFHVTRTDLINAICDTNKPVILSTGMSTLEEIDAAVELMRNRKADFAVLQCTSSYPTKDCDVNLAVIPEFKKRYNCVVGYSGHEDGISVAASSVVLGGRVLEKHFTLDRTLRGPDHAASLEPKGLRLLVERVRHLEIAMGSPHKRVLECELKNRKKNRGV